VRQDLGRERRGRGGRDTSVGEEAARRAGVAGSGGDGREIK
jgi:hypothetical protein